MVKRKSLLVALLAFMTTIGVESTFAQVTATQQFFVIKECKPGVQRIGVILSAKAAEDPQMVADLSRAGAASGVKVFVSPVSSIQDVAPKVRDLIRGQQVQAIWVPESSGVVADGTARKFIITNATQSRVPLFAPSAQWVKEGAAVSLMKEGSSISLSVNKAAADATALQIPDKYKDRTQLVAAN